MPAIIAIDIETGPLPDSHIRAIADPFTPPPHPGEFDLSSVRYGNMKDEAKKAEKLAKCQADHAAAVADYEKTVAAAEAEYWAKVTEKAALDATIGHVVAIGYRCDSINLLKIDGQNDGQNASSNDPIRSEYDILSMFWRLMQANVIGRPGVIIVGHYLSTFDLPFICRRSLVHGIRIPEGVFERGRYLAPQFVDTAEIWRFGTRDNVSLNRLAKSLGVGEKNGEGADFARLWFGTPEEHMQARDYLLNDLNMTLGIAERLGVGAGNVASGDAHASVAEVGQAGRIDARDVWRERQRTALGPDGKRSTSGDERPGHTERTHT